MHPKTIELILKAIEIIANIFISSKEDKPGGKKHDNTRSGKKKREGSGTEGLAS
jgi:hypothetical protein